MASLIENRPFAFVFTFLFSYFAQNCNEKPADLITGFSIFVMTHSGWSAVQLKKCRCAAVNAVYPNVKQHGKERPSNKVKTLQNDLKLPLINE